MLIAIVSTHIDGYGQNSDITILNAFPGISFTRPVFLTHAGDGSDRIFIVEQPGRIKVFPNDPEVNNARVSTFIDINARVNSGGNEQGLLGLAFHPNYSENGYFYVNYTADNPNRTVISRFSVTTDNRDLADSNSELIVLEIPQPFSNHNGGMIAFGPDDNYLYIGMGDGGSGGDPRGHGQNLQTLLGAILRIDVDNSSGGSNYSIPNDNPFKGNSQQYREEIWAYGLRNPWRFSFDAATKQLWAGDVGQNAREEIDLIEKAGNYGWKLMEGSVCYVSNCNTTGLIQPVVDYRHTNSSCFSVTGGYIYRGQRQPGLQGKYIYGDYCTGQIWALTYNDGQLQENSALLNTSFPISSFGVDQNNELYILNHSGSVYHFNEDIVSTVDEKAASNAAIAETFHLQQNYPNPFNPLTTIRYDIYQPGFVTLVIYNSAGKTIKTLVNGHLQNGSFQAIWDGTDNPGNRVASGIYLYTLQTQSQSITRKMLMLK
jgi:glucose/arabinose dehydrogenase